MINKQEFPIEYPIAYRVIKIRVKALAKVCNLNVSSSQRHLLSIVVFANPTHEAKRIEFITQIDCLRELTRKNKISWDDTDMIKLFLLYLETHSEF